MSADEWMECPDCAKPHNTRLKKLDQVLANCYDKITAKQYRTLQCNIDKLKEKIRKIIEDKASIGIYGVHDYYFDEQGNFISKVSAKCYTCNKEWKSISKEESLRMMARR
ncbi:hypothetical protein KAU43_06280 [candidate division WOR-3 bacterium]|nr:hypothetical protein [candidate division WOR-3 bacterium]